MLDYLCYAEGALLRSKFIDRLCELSDGASNNTTDQLAKLARQVLQEVDLRAKLPPLPLTYVPGRCLRCDREAHASGFCTTAAYRAALIAIREVWKCCYFDFSHLMGS